MKTERRYVDYIPAPAWWRLFTRLRNKIRPVAPEEWRGDPDQVRLVHEYRGWVLRWAEPSHGTARHYGNDRLDQLLEWARSRYGDRIEAVAVRVDADLTVEGASVVRRDAPTRRPWVELVCDEPGPLLAAAHEFFGPGDWVAQPGEAPTYVTR